MNKKILKLAIPNIISNISIPLLGIVDMALMGHLESDAYIGAIALVVSLLLLLLQNPIEMLSFLILKGETRVEALAMEYFRIRIWAVPAALGQ